MCSSCIIERVRQAALSRRSFFARSGAAGAAAIAAGSVSARRSLAQSTGRVVDLTHTYDATFPTFNGQPGFSAERVKDIHTDGMNIFRITVHEHTGTHVDAPLHFTEDGLSVAELAPESLVCPLCVIDIKAKAKDDPRAAVSKADVEAWISAHGDIPAGACVAMNSGWAAKVGDTSYRNLPDGSLAFPGFSTEAAELLAELSVAAIAVDTLSLDPGSTGVAVHSSWLPGGRYGIENLNNLDLVPAKGATVFVGAPKHRGGTGGPSRIMAMF